MPVIAYHDRTTKDLKVAKCGNASCSSGNTITSVDSTAVNQGWYPSIAIGTDGLPVISYFDAKVANQDLKVAKCGNPSCSSGNTITSVDTEGFVGFYTSIAIGTDGLPVISYVERTADGTNQHLKVAKCGNASCSLDNTITSLDTGGDVDYETSIAIGKDGFPVISYYDITARDLNVAKCMNAFCIPFTPPVLTPIGNKNVEATKQLVFNVSASDPDDAPFTYQGQPLPYGPSLNFQINPLPLGATFLPLGDVTLDRKVDVGDALFINQYLGGTRTFTQTQKLLADVTEDNLISQADVDEITKLTVVIPPPSIPNPTHMNKYLLVWTPTTTQVGTHQPTFTVSDGQLTDTEAVTILVLPKPISHWKFDETSGTTASDSIDSNPGTLVNGPTWTTGKLQGAVNLDGINDYITVASNPNLAMGTGSFTIAGWINLDVVCGPSWSDKICPIISTRGLSSTSMGDGYWVGLALSHLWFQIGDGGANNGDFLVPFSFTNSWHHIAAVRDRTANQFKLYIDGQLKGTDPDTLGDVGNSFVPYIGQQYTFFFDGKMDDLRIYNRALSPAEITALAQ